MSDDELRTHERRFRETRAVADEAAWIAARVRASELSATQVAVAALCGHEAAMAAAMGGRRRTLDECAGTFGVRPTTVRGWVRKGCPATRVGTVLELDVAAVVRWQAGQPWPAIRKHDTFVRTLARVDPEAAECFRELAGPSVAALRPALAAWVLGDEREGGWDRFMEPLERDGRPAVTEWLVRQLELRPGAADRERRDTAAAFCLLRRDRRVDVSRLRALPEPRLDAVDRLIRFLARTCECALGFKARSPSRMNRLVHEGKVEHLEHDLENVRYDGEINGPEYWTRDTYRCLTCGSKWLASTCDRLDISDVCPAQG